MPSTVKPAPCAWRAKFRTLKVLAGGETHRVSCELEMELRPVMVSSNLFHIYWSANGRLVSGRAYTLANAKTAAAALFIEQLTAWSPVSERDRSASDGARG